jgi:type II restriction enzyme
MARSIEQTPWLTNLRSIIRILTPVGGTFHLHDLYAFEHRLAEDYPNNNHLRDTIRDKMQELRDRGDVEFVDGEGLYRRMFR